MPNLTDIPANMYDLRTVSVAEYGRYVTLEPGASHHSFTPWSPEALRPARAGAYSAV
jgi:hypothetical protein